MDLDLDVAYEAYLARFKDRFGDKKAGDFVKFGKHMVEKLDRPNFVRWLRRYMELHGNANQMLKDGATINEALVLDFQEASAWVAIEAPNLMEMFRG
ncbi:MAG: hypothetical protein KC416_04785, partial [Myxococcales bacterium]|nr:hypothetical protein [Myxococcales bacterium]